MNHEPKQTRRLCPPTTNKQPEQQGRARGLGMHACMPACVPPGRGPGTDAGHHGCGAASPPWTASLAAANRTNQHWNQCHCLLPLMTALSWTTECAAFTTESRNILASWSAHSASIMAAATSASPAAGVSPDLASVRNGAASDVIGALLEHISALMDRGRPH